MIKVGFFGLAGPDWMNAISLPEVQLEYFDYVEKGREFAQTLRSEQHGCDLVIALTHMRAPDDRILASQVHEIDLILGGHDHSYLTEVDASTGVVLIKSGSDFEAFNDFSLFFDCSDADYT